ncbi:MAG: hypothetical protein ACHQCF_06755 [Solirubrobacterales bacterium]
MSTETEIAIAQIDLALKAVEDARSRSRHDDLSDLGPENAKLVTLCAATVSRLAPPGSPYTDTIDTAVAKWDAYHHLILPSAVGALEALKQDYEAGNLASLPELIHAELFGDFLEMADHLLDGGFKDAAAVIAGSTLEGHLRQLAEKTGIPTIDAEGHHLKADRLNADLVKAEAYEKTDQKSITAWLGLRNHAAHGDYEKYEAGQVGPMIAGIRDFIRRKPA